MEQLQVVLNTEDTDIQYQTAIVTVSPDGVPMQVRMQFRYARTLDKWFVTVINTANDESICREVPLVGSAEGTLVDLLGPWHHKAHGSLFCYPVVTVPDSQDPGEYNLDQFEIVWSDTVGDQ